MVGIILFLGLGDNIWGGFGRQEPQKEVGGDIYVNLNVSLQDIYKQKHIEFKYNKRVPCNHCNGTGAEKWKIKLLLKLWRNWRNFKH